VDIDELLQVLPTRRIKPVDGLAVTAAVWEEAHDYHRLRQRFHSLLSHGPGILAGLEVIASDPPDTSVYVMPGVAIGTGGELVVLAEPVAYDIAAAQGPLHVLLSYGEGPPRAGGGPDQGAEILYVHAEFGIEAQLNPASDSGVELARIRRRDRQAPITNAHDSEHPAPNEIDLRFRRGIGAHSQEAASMAICYAGQPHSERHHRGANALGRAMRHAGKTPLWVDDDVPLDPELASYTLVYLVGQGSFELGADQMNALYTYLQGGGTVFLESCRQDLAAGDPLSDAAFFGLLKSLGVHLEPVPPGHPLLTDPYLFAAPPPGFAAEGDRKLLAGDGVVFSNYDYGCLWQGERHGGPPTREEIRAALEWGSNVVAYAVRRRNEFMNERMNE
jgi:hypothetical protein